MVTTVYLVPDRCAAQTVVNKGGLYIGNNAVVFLADHFFNEGEYYNNGQVTFRANIENNGNMAVDDKGTTILDGNIVQHIAGRQPLHFFRLNMNSGIGGVAYLLENEMGVHQELGFLNGVVETTGQGCVTFFNKSIPVGPSDKSHVFGKVKKWGNEGFAFPIGDEKYYRPATISAPQKEEEAISGEYFRRNDGAKPYDPRITDGQIGAVNPNEYWVLNREAGNTPVRVGLTWNASKGVTITASLSRLLMARWNGSKWENAGKTNVTGDSQAGSLSTVSGLQELGPFTFTEMLGKMMIGLAQVASTPRLEPDQTYTVDIKFILRNMGDLPLDSVRLTHNLANVFPFPMSIRRTGTVKHSAGEIAANQHYDGSTDVELLLALSKLAPNTEDTVSFTVNITPEGRSGTFNSTAEVTGSNGGLVVRDISNNNEVMPVGGSGAPTDYNAPTPITLQAISIRIPEGISPNGDGKNDLWVIDGLKATDQVDMKIFNRWGDVVYENPDYRNNWNGFSNRGLRVGNTLPDGTYYYVISVKDRRLPGKAQRFVGFLTLLR
ncbi:gliding motility-associated C-terminal domain-containing protein [Chitinophaga oryzae]|uniref:Gliding motility-associated C-terminal domain-containing protein n=1 Tax=Chitinophaga oryzae TaxID=2725414 RepID=A0AAE7D7A7_9BACT|nr:gliding motility-associated C-terminal domain-containing protein [Chitinophaga oryzae]QJB32565.1 gliding motility-associated C-terminal domain-containing protein [Chitinophaga oryzae]